MTPVTEHFHLEEFDSHDGVQYPAGWVADRLLPLCEMLEVIRAAWGGPLEVVSGYRSPQHNLAVGGAQASQHMEGRAADIRPRLVSGEALSATCERLHATVLDLYHAGQIQDLGGCGIYPAWLHCDIRPKPADGHLAQWSGVKVGDEQTG